LDWVLFTASEFLTLFGEVYYFGIMAVVFLFDAGAGYFAEPHFGEH
jgi:hypothetical protein